MVNSAIDHFSSKSKEYSFSRPLYPDNLFQYLSEITPNKDLAWDCATGNGQAAISLCKYFKKVIASDASKGQIDNRFEKDNNSNIDYDVFPAENANIRDNSVDLITVAQAIHWFDFEDFYREVRRVSKRNNGIIAIWSYGMHKVTPEIDRISEKLNVGGDILGNYWSPETKYIKENYETIPFPFREISSPKFEIKVNWNLEEIFNYMNTWSSVKRFQREKGYSPLDLVKKDIKNLWGKEDEHKLVRWNINLRIGFVHS
ncbi:MAG: class I SAM-dependent methyltransferase [Thermoproteota archaeon]|nr:class I SAM-dependent methyltransferase [Thermoproteota archaeon]